MVDVQNSRFVAYHLGLSGHPCKNLDYRILATYQDAMGTYDKPYTSYKNSFNLMVEASYRFPHDWRLTEAFGMDRGEVHGNNVGGQLTVRKTIYNIRKQ